MNKNEERKEERKDEILEELWNVKDYYSLSCNSNFKILLKIIREDIKNWKKIVEKVNIQENLI